MLASEYYTFKNMLQEKGIILSYSGFVTEGVLHALGQALRQKLAADETDANLRKRVFSVFVEQVQNVIRYSAETEQSPPPTRLSSGIVTVGADGPAFFVLCANVLDRTKVPRLRERLEALSGMDADALKAYYRQKLRDPPDEDSEGATIGLIEIARRVSRPLIFDFVDIDEQASFFCLKAYI